MQSRTINNYRYFCNTENIYVYDWSDSMPMCCSNDITHHIDNESISIIDTVQSSNVTICQHTGDIDGNFRIESKVISIPANQTTSCILSWPFNVCIMTVNWTTSDIHKGDIINGYVGENTIIGSLTRDTNMGDSKIFVTPSVLQYIKKGYLVKITDKKHIINMEQCISIDKASDSITCEVPANMSLSAGSYVMMSINNIRNIHIGEPETMNLATKHIGSSSIPIGTKLRFEYQNNGSIAKTFIFKYEYLY